MTSKIEDILIKATGLKPKAKESDQAWYDRLVQAVQALPAKEWDKIGEVSAAAQEWVNDGATASNEKKNIKGFPDEKTSSPPKTVTPSPKSRLAERDDRDRDPPRRSSRDDERDPPRRSSRDDERDPPRRSSRDDRDDDRGRNNDKDRDPPRRDARRDRDDENDRRPPRRSRDDDEGSNDAPRRERETEGSDMSGNGKKGVAKKTASKGKGTPAPRKEASRAPRKEAPREQSAVGFICEQLVLNPGATNEKIGAALDKKKFEATDSTINTTRSATLRTLRLVKIHGMPKGDI